MPAELDRTARRVRYCNASGHSQPRTPEGRIIKYRQLVSAIACLLPAAVLAGPKNGQVVAGEANISTPDANTTVIRQHTDKSIINWQSFSIGSQEYVKFVQPDRTSLSLNRVIGGNPSSILGKLSANGQVYLVNPNGIYFGQGARVDVSGIVASVLDISNVDFMNENFIFQGDADANLGKVINDGIINARNEGFVVLMGDYSENNGVIQAHMGKVVLASGSHITMDISGNNLISVAVDEAAVSELAGVKNSGDIYADGGRVIMTAKVADNLIGSAVNNEGLVRAASIVEKDGAIFLTGSGGDIVNSGTLDASAAVDSNVDGGGVLVYSDRDVTLSPGSAINARGDGDGAGGVVRVIAEDILDFQAGAAISVSGAPHAGGFVEVSGHAGLSLRGDVDLGSGGSLLIDPSLLTLFAGGRVPAGGPTAGSVGASFIAAQLTAGNNVSLIASSSIAASGSMTIAANNTGAGDLKIQIATAGGVGTLGGPTSSNQCAVSGFCSDGAGGTPPIGSFAVTQQANGSIDLGNVNFVLDGNLQVNAGLTTGSVALGSINAGGSVTVTAGTDINITNNITAGTAGLNLDAGNNVNISGSTTGPLAITIPGAMNVTGVNFNVNGADYGTTGTSADQDASVSVQADSIIVNISGDMTLMAGQINLDVALGATGAGGTTASVDTSVTVTGTNQVNVTANNLTIQGGVASASVEGRGYTSSAAAFANAELTATTGNITLNLGGSLNVRAGLDNAVNFEESSSDVALADANASITAGGAVNIIAATGVSMGGFSAGVYGVALASAQGSLLSTFGGSFYPVHANANVLVDAGTNIAVTIANGDLSVLGGMATGRVTSSSGSSRIASASANVMVQAGGNMTVSIATGNLAIQGGIATAEGSATNSNDFAVIARANADLQVSGNLIVNSVGTDIAIRGGTAAARILAASTCSTCSASAQANASVQAGIVTISNVGGNFDLIAGNAQANLGFSSGSRVESGALISANANATLAAASQTIAVNGTMTLAAGTAMAGGTWSSGTAQILSHADVTLDASSGVLSLTASNIDVAGGIAVIGSATIGTNTISSVVAGDDGTVAATANADVSAAGDAIIVTTNGLSINGGDAFVSFADVDDTISGSAIANATLQAGQDVNITAASGSIAVQGGNATAVNDADGVPRRAFADAGADALLRAGVDVRVNSATGLAVNGGDAIAILGGTSVSCNITCSADATAKATLTARNIQSVSVIAGGINFAGGNAFGSFSVSGDGTFSFASAIVSADASALVSATQNITLDASGSINVFGDSANLGGNLDAASRITMDANASVLLSAGGNIDLSAGGSRGLVLSGGRANAFSQGSASGTATAISQAAIVATGAVTINVSAGSVSLTGGFTNPGSSYSSGSSRSVGRGGNVGSVGLAVATGEARPSGSSGSSPLRRASANALVSANQLQVMANANIDGSFASINANGIYLSAGNNIDLFRTITSVGNGTAPGISGDSLLLDIMDRADIGLPANNNPNALFEAGGSLFTGDVTMSATNGYLWFSADQLSVDSISIPAGPLLVQYSPFTPTHDIAFEDLQASPQPLQVDYDNSNHVSPIPMTTVAIGSAQQSGPITVGANGVIDIGARNIIFLTRPDDVTSPANIITTGIVATSGFVGSLSEVVFVTPRLDNFEVEVENWWLEAERRKEQLIEEGAAENGMCIAI